MPRLSAEHPPERSPDPPKHVRHCRRFPLSTPRRPNAATIERGGDLPKRLRPGSLGLPDGRRDAIGECVGAGRVVRVGYRAGLGELGIAEGLSAGLGGGQGGNRALAGLLDEYLAAQKSRN